VRLAAVLAVLGLVLGLAPGGGRADDVARLAPASPVPSPEAAAPPALPQPPSESDLGVLDDPAARRLAEAWFDQLLGFDALEAYEVPFESIRISFVIARRWTGDTVRILIDVVEPKVMDEIAALFLQNQERGDDFFVYMTPQIPNPAERRVRRFLAPRLDFSMPFGGIAVPIGEVRPFLRGELDGFRRLPDEVVSGEPCRVVEADVVNERFQFDRLRLALSDRTGVALETRYVKGDRIVRRILVDPGDVESQGGRMLPTRRRIETSVKRGGLDLVLRNLMIDPVLPDRLFTSHSLRYQRFPTF
jgi:hypothetical protein